MVSSDHPKQPSNPDIVILSAGRTLAICESFQGRAVRSSEPKQANIGRTSVIYSTLYVPPAHLTGPGSKAAEPRIGASTAYACALWVYGHSPPPSVGQTLDITPAKTNRLAPMRLIPQHCEHGSGPTKAGLALRILYTRSMAHSDMVQGWVLTTSHGRGLGDSRYKCDAWDAGIRGLTQSIRQEMLLAGLNHENGRAYCCGTPRLRWPSEYC
jgi:hypothetical protein